MTSPKNHFILFKKNIENYSIPEKLTFPFNYSPHALAQLAAEEIQEVIKNTNWNHNFGFEPHSAGKVMGKMFGVLVVKNEENELGYLAAFSGKIGDENHHPNFVPPVFDRLTEDGFYKTQEEIVSQINRKIETLETHPDYLFWIAKLEEEKMLSTKELTSTKQAIKAQKIIRQQKRVLAKNTLSPEELEQFQKKLNEESQSQQRHYKRLAKQWKTQLETTQQQVNQLNAVIELLKIERKTKSALLQQQLFQQYTFLNQSGEEKSLLAIFETTALKLPPAGAGECAAPKLFHYAFKHHLKPVALAEFWWGESPKMEIKKHGHYYPACKSKCEPILGHMLNGLDLDENPIDEDTSTLEVKILFEDDYLAVIHKPTGLLSIPGKSKRDSVAFRMKQKYPDATGPLVVHRLDMATSGLMLIAKTQEVHKILQSQFIKHNIKKRYVALLDGLIEANEGTIDLPLRVDIENRPHQLVCFDYGKAARTHWKVILRSNKKTRIHFFPITGRTHQLRVHAAHPQGLNTPIIGDDLYGTAANRLHLHAEYIEFIHPISNEVNKFELLAEF